MGNKTRPKSTRTAIIRIPARGLQFAEFFPLEPVGRSLNVTEQETPAVESRPRLGTGSP
jgi:hypothetical protein